MSYGVEDAFYRVEFQQRGAPHVHQLLYSVAQFDLLAAQKLKPDDKQQMEKISKEIFELSHVFVESWNKATEYQKECNQTFSDEDDQGWVELLITKRDFGYKQTKGQERFTLLDLVAQINIFPVDDLVKAENVKVVNSINKKITDLINYLQRHTSCRVEQCMKNGRCRFRFPKNFHMDQTTYFSFVNDVLVNLELTEPRNDSFLNAQNKLQTLLFESNGDVKINVKLQAIES